MFRKQNNKFLPTKKLFLFYFLVLAGFKQLYWIFVFADICTTARFQKRQYSFDNYIAAATSLRMLWQWSQGRLQLVGHWAGKYEINNTTL